MKESVITIRSNEEDKSTVTKLHSLLEDKGYTCDQLENLPNVFVFRRAAKVKKPEPVMIKSDDIK